MKNLYERLKPEYKEIFDSELESYPYIYIETQKQLQNLIFICDIAWNAFHTLKCDVFRYKNKVVQTPYELFDND